jgi:hypothetical protein
VTVHRVWQRAGLQPHRLEHYVTSNDPAFEAKAADVIGLYLKPPTNAVVFSVDEKSHIQALDRRDPVLPLSPGRAERHGFEYKRNGTLSLYAALDVGTYRWKRKYTGLGKAELQRLKALEDENRRLKRMVADQALNIQVLKDALGKEW